MRKHSTCRQCGLDWNECQCSSWPLSQLVYSRHQIFVYLHNQGWPEHNEGYLSDKVQSTRQDSGGFERWIDAIVEIDARVEACGEAGEALRWEAPNVEVIDQLSPPARRALNYCSGWRRRRETYERWKWKQEQKGLKQSLPV
jgi:hypothetical protein